MEWLYRGSFCQKSTFSRHLPHNVLIFLWRDETRFRQLGLSPYLTFRIKRWRVLVIFLLFLLLRFRRWKTLQINSIIESCLTIWFCFGSRAHFILFSNFFSPQSRRFFNHLFFFFRDHDNFHHIFFGSQQSKHIARVDCEQSFNVLVIDKRLFPIHNFDIFGRLKQ